MRIEISNCSNLTPTKQGSSPYGRPARETLFGEEWRVLSLMALPPMFRAGVPPSGRYPWLNLEVDAVFDHEE